MKSIESVFLSLETTYPRNHPPLLKEWRERYEEVYKSSRGGRSFLYRISQALESWMHKKVAGKSPSPDQRILEIGAGNLNHIKYETAFSRYDVVEPFQALWLESPERESVSNYFQDVSDIPISQTYEKVISIASLEHIENLPIVVAMVGLRLAPGGRFCVGIPSEGGLLWGLSWRLSLGVAFRIRYGLCYGDLMRHEHLSDANEIVTILRFLFRSCTVQRFPLNSPHLSLYAYIDARDPIIERCHQVCGSRYKSGDA